MMPPPCGGDAPAPAAAVACRGLAAAGAAPLVRGGQGAHPDSIRFYSMGELQTKSSFRHRRFVLDYARSGAAAADPLPALLQLLGAQVIPELQQSSDELIVDQEEAQLSWRA
jgi:hypothetical protein